MFIFDFLLFELVSSLILSFFSILFGVLLTNKDCIFFIHVCWSVSSCITFAYSAIIIPIFEILRHGFSSFSLLFSTFFLMIHEAELFAYAKSSIKGFFVLNFLSRSFSSFGMYWLIIDSFVIWMFFFCAVFEHHLFALIITSTFSFIDCFHIYFFLLLC